LPVPSEEPISDEPPYGAMTVVYRRGTGALEYLLLHRPYGADYEGDWAWGPPAGGRFPGEDVDLCAARETLEETGLDLPVRRTDVPSADWFVYLAEAPESAEVRLSHEHDRYEWLPLDRAAARILPERVRACLIEAARTLSARA
jgi:8-oxo-dGTP pyrophosphatase MutT (NUDIX family)